eukprot:CAMPEP_0185027032 /NCGR_PEP_ID=MMETSP1103-20130426/11853_1 /TAXON_ID=36769 /ORGANISM="Paraphysomonas bandaiensis, Strain Caron Lab Isolate" /LENGTH=406 /DNA_ID=CAMNT_0027560875 /DNA_START=266 /DNA_END=1486 /DNA_ORIENTATION=+
MLKSAAQLLNPTLYASRLQEVAQEKALWETVLPVFFYISVMFPGELLHLHLFEPRYKIMMQRVMATTRRFAYLYVSPHMPVERSIALIATVRHADFSPDGRCNLEAVLEFPRNKVTELFEEPGTNGLHYARLETYVDDPITSSSFSSTGPEQPTYHSQQATSRCPHSPTSQLEQSTMYGDGISRGEGQVANGLRMAMLLANEAMSILRRLDMSSASRSFLPLPLLPEEVNDSSHQSREAILEHLSLAIAGRCPVSSGGEKASYLRSKNTVERLRFCIHLLTRLEDQRTSGIGSMLGQSVGSIISWISGHTQRHGDYEDGSSDDENEERHNESAVQDSTGIQHDTEVSSSTNVPYLGEMRHSTNESPEHTLNASQSDQGDAMNCELWDDDSGHEGNDGDEAVIPGNN